MLKICSKCGEPQPVSEFNKDKHSSDGLDTRCRTCNRARALKWRIENPDKHESYRKQPHVMRAQRENNRRYRKDAFYRMQENARKLVKRCLTNAGYTKRSRSKEILGCTYDFLVGWLEHVSHVSINEQFHIDHVIPISLAKTEQEVLWLSHFSNLQLLLPTVNTSKGNRYILKENLERVLNCHPCSDMLSYIVKREQIRIR